MKSDKFLRVAIVALMILLVIDMGSRMLTNPPQVGASGTIQYKVVWYEKFTGPTPSYIQNEYEKFLNDMVKAGWEYDHFAGGQQSLVVFKKK